MIITPRALALTGGIALLFSSFATVAQAASPTTFPLRGTKMATMAHGIAQVTKLGAGDYKITVTISAMPMAATLHTMPVRHAYVAWAFNASMLQAKPTKGKSSANPATMLGKLIPIALHETKTGTYTGTGTVMMMQAPGIVVTAEVNAMVHTPVAPFWGVLFGSPMKQ